MTTPHTSGAADLRTTFSEILVDLPNTEPYTIFKAGFDAALAAGQATAAPAQPAAQQGAAYAALPEPAGKIEYPGAYYEAAWVSSMCAFDENQMRAFADATYALRAAHGQAPAPEDSVQEDAARESEYQRGYRHGYEQRDAEVRGALA